MQKERNMISRLADEDQALDLYSIFTDVLKHWVSVVLLTVSAILFSYVVLSLINPLKYATTATMVVTNINEEETSDSNAGTDVYENLNYAADSASRLKNILASKELKETVAKSLGLKKFEGTATASTLGESNLLEIKVRADSPYISYMETDAILDNYTHFSGDLVGGVSLTVLEKPKVQESPEDRFQNVKYAILIGALVFAAISAVLAFFSFMRDTVRNSKEVESKIDAKLLATIVHEEKHKKGKKRIGGEKASILITDPVTSFQYAEGMRKLAARVINEMTEKGYKTVLVSSATENEGKSTVSANIALAMSQIDKKVLLIDMDFRKPSMYKILNMQEEQFNELNDFLEVNGKGGEQKIRENRKKLICRVPGTELSAVLTRKAAPQMMEKNAGAVKAIIDNLKEDFDFVVIDTAPISLVSDAEELSSMVDTSIIVIRQHLVEAREINDTIDSLGGREHLLGCVFNNARKDSTSTSNAGYGYGYGGHYAG